MGFEDKARDSSPLERTGRVSFTKVGSTHRTADEGVDVWAEPPKSWMHARRWVPINTLEICSSEREEIKRLLKEQESKS